MQVINIVLFKEKKKILQYKEISLLPSEVHLMLMVKNDRNTNATEIAKQLGLTKGAVSQTIARLERKDILRKTKDPYKKNELTLSLTDVGKKACKQCQSMQTSFIKANEAYLEKLSAKEKETILGFLQNAESIMSR